MEKNNLKVGMIVTVITGAAYGHKAGTVTKILSKPGAVADGLFEYLGHRITGEISSVLCQDVRSLSGTYIAYRNTPALYEMIWDLRPATEKEKKEFRKSK